LPVLLRSTRFPVGYNALPFAIARFSLFRAPDSIKQFIHAQKIVHPHLRVPDE
jgi:hypothetical protein